MLNTDQLTGRWTIVSWEQRYDDGRLAYPLGRELEGFIQYDADGRMVCMMERAQRAAFSGGQWNSPAAERAEGYSGFMAYAGSYSIEGDTAVHHVRHSLFPNWKHGVQRRAVRWIGGADRSQDQLIITARLEDGTSEARDAVLTWRRATDESSTVAAVSPDAPSQRERT